MTAPLLSPALLTRNLVVFGRVLRASGIAVDPGQLVDVQRALALITPTDAPQFYYAARAVFVRRLEELPLFDRAFALFWSELARRDLLPDFPSPDGRREDVVIPLPPEPEEPVLAGMTEEPSGKRPAGAAATVQEHAGTDELAPPREQVVPIRTYSAAERLRQKDFGHLTPAELEEARTLLQQLRWQVGRRRARRTHPAFGVGPGRGLHWRATVRTSLRAAGELTRLAWRVPKTKPRPLVILGDISGSMDRYTRLLLQFFYAVRRGRSEVEVFVFGTRLTRITRDLEHRNVEEAMRRVAAHILDWSGGTRIGAALRTFNRQWARRVLSRGAVTIVVSDGWDRGEAELLRTEIARLQRTSFRLIWLNPLLGDAQYQPLTVGMQTALPYVDDFLPAHNLASLTDLARRLSDLEQRRPLRRMHR
ncbi:MAG: VWA domain-containing protein [Chloroflexi bacterium]|nr:VWA domain-containing protein [Chloroflexota bacterium]